jgi:membrane associated rhomboid family serine protease
MFHSNYSFSPKKIQPIIKYLALTIATFSIFFTLIAPFIKINFPLFLLLSKLGISKGLIYQFISCFFVTFEYGLSLGFLVKLMFCLYIIWIAGENLIVNTSKIQFAIFYFGCGIFSSLAAYLVEFLGYPLYLHSGLSCLVFGLLTSWMMFNTTSQIILFFSLRIPIKWLVSATIGISLLSDFSRSDFVSFFATLAAIIFSYFFTLIVWKMRSPFNFLQKFEIKLLNIFYSNLFKTKTKIYDFKTGKSLNDS